uniref:Scaffolding protein n=1 Tax=viral metagenome TaxID=1070528 RepID=A0A6M3KFJ1_9ZZZZ
MKGQENQVTLQENTAESVETTVTDEAKTEKSYTQEEVAKMQSTFEKKARQSEREAKQYKGEVDTVRSEISTLTEQLATLSSEIQRREMEGLADLPQGQQVARLLESARRKEADLIKKEQDLKKMQNTALEGLKFKDALALSKEYDIDVDDLMECDTMAEMYKTALKLTKEKVTTPKTEVKPAAKIPDRIDSAISNAAGKGRMWKASEITSMSSDERFDKRSEIATAQREGRIDHTK